MKGLRVATLNLGAGGLGKSLTSLRSWILQNDLDILHMQEVRDLSPGAPRKGRRKEWVDVMKYMPEYTIFHNGRQGDGSGPV